VILLGLGLGVGLAAQLGPVSLLIVRSMLRGGRAIAVGLVMAGAVTLVDVLYATVGLAGAGRLLDAGGLRTGLGVISGAILIAIGARTLWRGVRARHGLEDDDEVATPARAFGTAFAATALNPLTIALWVVSFPAAAPHAAAARAGTRSRCSAVSRSARWPGTAGSRRSSRWRRSASGGG
jgi:putative LysE/RhtB family amino acid efflux pump